MWKMQVVMLAVLFPIASAAISAVGGDADDSLSLIQKKAGRSVSHPRRYAGTSVLHSRRSRRHAQPVHQLPGAKEALEGRPDESPDQKAKDENGVDLDDPYRLGECEKAKDTTCSVTLLGSMAFIMGIFYLIHASSVLMGDTAWTMVSAMVSIFVAVLTHGAVHKTVCLLLDTKSIGIGEEGAEALGLVELPPSLGDITISAVQLLVWWVLFSVLLFVQKRSLLHLKAYGTIGGHILGFAAIDVFGKLATSDYFRTSHYMTLVLLGIFSVVLPFMMWLPEMLTRWAMQHYHVAEETIHQWYDQCKDTMTDFFCFGGSFLVCFWFRYLFTGSVPHLGGITKSHTIYEQQVMLHIGLGLVCLSGIFAKFHHWRHLDNYMDIASNLTAMTASWFLLFSADWTVYDTLGSSMMARTFIALTFSVVSIAFVLLSYVMVHHYRASRRALRGMLTAVSLAVGLSWEKVFDEAIEDLEGAGGRGDRWGSLPVIVFTLALVLFVFPAWVAYMLPNADDALKKLLADRLKNGSLDLSAVWDDSDLYPTKGSSATQ